MNYQSMLDIIVALPFDTMTTVYSNNSQSIIVFRPSQLSERFKNYDVNTNFQIFLKIGDAKPFRPNHLRLLLDLKLRSRDLPSYKNEMLFAFDKIFYKDDPLSSIKPLSGPAFLTGFSFNS